MGAEEEKMKEIVITPKEKLIELISSITETPVEREVVIRLHHFSKKFINDVVSRSCLLAEHKQNNAISAEDIFYVVEKEFDYVFGDSDLLDIRNIPHPDHVDK